MIQKTHPVPPPRKRRTAPPRSNKLQKVPIDEKSNEILKTSENLSARELPKSPMKKVSRKTYPPLFFTLKDFENVMSAAVAQQEDGNSAKSSINSFDETSFDDELENTLFRVTTGNLPFEKHENEFAFDDYIDRSRRPTEVPSFSFDKPMNSLRFPKVRFILEADSTENDFEILNIVNQSECSLTVEQEEWWQTGRRSPVKIEEIPNSPVEKASANASGFHVSSMNSVNSTSTNDGGFCDEYEDFETTGGNFKRLEKFSGIYDLNVLNDSGKVEMFGNSNESVDTENFKMPRGENQRQTGNLKFPDDFGICENVNKSENLENLNSHRHGNLQRCANFDTSERIQMTPEDFEFSENLEDFKTHWRYEEREQCECLGNVLEKQENLGAEENELKLTGITIYEIPDNFENSQLDGDKNSERIKHFEVPKSWKTFDSFELADEPWNFKSCQDYENTEDDEKQEKSKDIGEIFGNLNDSENITGPLTNSYNPVTLEASGEFDGPGESGRMTESTSAIEFEDHKKLEIFEEITIFGNEDKHPENSQKSLEIVVSESSGDVIKNQKTSAKDENLTNPIDKHPKTEINSNITPNLQKFDNPDENSELMDNSSPPTPELAKIPSLRRNSFLAEMLTPENTEKIDFELSTCSIIATHPKSRADYLKSDFGQVIECTRTLGKIDEPCGIITSGSMIVGSEPSVKNCSAMLNELVKNLTDIKLTSIDDNSKDIIINKNETGEISPTGACSVDKKTEFSYNNNNHNNNENKMIVDENDENIDEKSGKFCENELIRETITSDNKNSKDADKLKMIDEKCINKCAIDRLKSTFSNNDNNNSHNTDKNNVMKKISKNIKPVDISYDQQAYKKQENYSFAISPGRVKNYVKNYEFMKIDNNNVIKYSKCIDIDVNSDDDDDDDNDYGNLTNNTCAGINSNWLSASEYQTDNNNSLCNAPRPVSPCLKVSAIYSPRCVQKKSVKFNTGHTVIHADNFDAEETGFAKDTGDEPRVKRRAPGRPGVKNLHEIVDVYEVVVRNELKTNGQLIGGEDTGKEALEKEPAINTTGLAKPPTAPGTTKISQKITATTTEAPYHKPPYVFYLKV